MGTPLAYLITWTLRGTWLHGDPRGSVDTEHNTFKTPYLPDQPNRRAAVAAQLRNPLPLLNASERAVIVQAITTTCETRGWGLLAMTARSNHVHVVVSAGDPPERVMRDLKSWSTRGVREVTPERTAGLWTRHGSTRYLWDEASVAAAIRYVNAHDQPGPRAHARGSVGGDMVEFTTERLILREPMDSDAELLHAAVFGDPAAMRYIGDGSVRSLEMVRASVEKRRRCLDEHGVTLWTVLRRDTGGVIGDCGVIPIDWRWPEFELAYRYTPSAWGHGFATEAGAAAMDHAWRASTLPVIYGVTDPENLASQRVLGKLGFLDLGTTDRYYGETLRYFRFDRPAGMTNNPA